jgi:hypothetical protein
MYAKLRTRCAPILGLTIILTLAGTLYAASDVAEQFGLNESQDGRASRQTLTSAQFDAEHERRLFEVCQLAIINERILDDVLAGRMELQTAAKLKWDLNHQRYDWVEVMEKIGQGPTREAKIAWNMITVAESRLQTAPDRAAILQRLSCEYAVLCQEPTSTTVATH